MFFMFFFCSALQTATLSSSLTSLGTSAFSGFTALESVTDADRDGDVTAQDASLIQQKVAGKISW